MNANTLPRAARAADDTGKSARNISRVFDQLGDNPQSLLYGSGNPVPGPGEPGFVAPIQQTPPRQRDRTPHGNHCTPPLCYVFNSCLLQYLLG